MCKGLTEEIKPEAKMPEISSPSIIGGSKNIMMNMDGIGNEEGLNDKENIAPRSPSKSVATSRSFSKLYRLKKDILGTGAFAKVRTAVSLSDNKEYAVKIVNKHYDDQQTRNKIMREIEICSVYINHPNIVRLIEWFEDTHRYYLVFEKISGGALLEQLQKRGHFHEAEASKIAREIGLAIKSLHSIGIAHRDIKPENILCTSKTTPFPIKLIDFDLASTPQNSWSSTCLESPVGSPEFMAPEVVQAFMKNGYKYGKECDLWSLGVLIYTMLCGYTPFWGNCGRDGCQWYKGGFCLECQNELFEKIQHGCFSFPISEWNGISSEANDLISKLLVVDPQKRGTIDEVLNHPWIMGRKSL